MPAPDPLTLHRRQMSLAQRVTGIEALLHSLGARQTAIIQRLQLLEQPKEPTSLEEVRELIASFRHDLNQVHENAQGFERDLQNLSAALELLQADSKMNLDVHSILGGLVDTVLPYIAARLRERGIQFRSGAEEGQPPA